MQALQEGSTAIDPQPRVVPFIFTRVMAPAIVSSRIKNPSMLMGSCSISTPVLTPIKSKDEDPILDADKLSSADLVKVSFSFSSVNLAQKQS